MSWNNKVVWSEGMFLQPHHLQQHDRYLQTLIQDRAAPLSPAPWGFSELQFDDQALALGKIALRSCRAVMPDGTPVLLPANDDLPEPLDIPQDLRDERIVLAVALRRPDVAETEGVGADQNFARYRLAELDVKDSNANADTSTLMQVGRLKLRLAVESEVANAYSILGVAHVVERRADNQVVLDPDFMPPGLDYKSSPRLGAFVDELLGLLHQRAEALANRMSQGGTSGVAEISDFLMLQLLNRAEPLFAHLAQINGLHTEALFRECVQLAGELATFSHATKRAPKYPIYRHDRLKESFMPLISELRQSLSTVLDTSAIPIPLEERKFGVRVAVLADKQLLGKASFVLAVNAQLPAETIRTGFPPQIKIGPIEKIRDLVNLQLPGIGLRPLPVAPRQLPFHAGFTYFELDQSNELWSELSRSAGFAMHLAGEFPGLAMEFWAIRR